MKVYETRAFNYDGSLWKIDEPELETRCYFTERAAREALARFRAVRLIKEVGGRIEV